MTNDSSGQRQFRGLFSTLVAGLCLPAAAFISSPLLARTLGAEGRGEVAALLAPVALMAVLLTLGIPEAIVHLTATLAVNGVTISRGRIFRALLVAFVVGCGGAICVALVQPLLIGASSRYLVQTIVVAASLPFALVIAVLRAVLQGFGHYRLVNWERWVSTLLRLTLLLVAAGTHLLTLSSAVYIICYSGIISGVLLVPTAVRTLHKAEAGSEAPVFSYGLRVWAGTVTGLLVLRLDQTVLAVAVPAAQLAFYVVAVAIAEIPQTGIAAVQQLLLARLSDVRQRDGFARTVRIAVAVTSLCVIAFSVVVSLLIRLFYGPEFIDAVIPTYLLLIGSGTVVITALLTSEALAQGRPETVFVAQLSSLTSNVALLFLLIPTEGIVGAAWASALSYAAGAIVLVAFSCRWTRRSPVDYLIVRRSDVISLFAKSEPR